MFKNAPENKKGIAVYLFPLLKTQSLHFISIHLLIIIKPDTTLYDLELRMRFCISNLTTISRFHRLLELGTDIKFLNYFVKDMITLVITNFVHIQLPVITFTVDTTENMTIIFS